MTYNGNEKLRGYRQEITMTDKEFSEYMRYNTDMDVFPHCLGASTILFEGESYDLNIRF